MQNQRNISSIRIMGIFIGTLWLWLAGATWPRPALAVCGDGVIDVGEECDDGGTCVSGSVGVLCTVDGTCGPLGACQPTGGDGCAANCTTETTVDLLRPLSASLPNSQMAVQAYVWILRFAASGRQIAQIGKAGSDGVTPVAIKTADVSFAPARIPGLGCACVRAREHPAFGAGVAGAGVVGCGPAGLPEVDIDVTRAHNIGVVGQGGFTAADCAAAGGSVEGGANPHPDVCNGPPQTSTHTQGPPGSALITLNTAVGLIPGGECSTDLRNRLNGPDGIPCTDDDPSESQGVATLIVSTTGTATATITQANNISAATLGSNTLCGSRPCEATAQGNPLDCSAFAAGSITEFTLASASAALDRPMIGDDLTTSDFFFVHFRVCGNGLLEEGEQCDDGNTTNGDGCSSTCTYELIPGNHAGLSTTDRRACMLEFSVVNPGNTPALDTRGRPNYIQHCKRFSRACDFDSDANACTFKVVACLNNVDPHLPSCVGQGVRDPVRILSPGATASPANYMALKTALQTVRDPATGLGQSLPVPEEAAGRCTDPFLIKVPLRGSVAGRERLTTLSRSDANSPVRNQADVDQVLLICDP